MTWWAWSLIAAAVALGVMVMAWLQAASNADDQMMGESQYEEHEPRLFKCDRCGLPALPHQLRSISGESRRVLIHAGGCPRDRQRPRRRTAE